MMQVLVPYTHINELTKKALDLYAPQALLYDVSGSDANYHYFVRDWWHKGEDFVLIEHDVQIHSDVLPQFEACPETWCVFRYAAGYDAQGQPVYHERGLGCVRFRSALLKAVDPFVKLHGLHWAHLDGDIRQALRPRKPHVHEPPVEHWH